MFKKGTLITKKITISRKKLKITGESGDDYFKRYFTEGSSFYDTPISYIEKHMPKDAVIFDVGANIGVVVLSARAISDEAIIHAFEPSPKIFGLLEKNVKANFGMKGVYLNNSALSSKKGHLNFFQDNEYLAGSRVVEVKNSKSIKVTALTLDEYVKKNKIKRLDIIKIDVEGHEVDVLKGARSTIEKLKPFVLVEFNTYAMVLLNRLLPQDFMSFLSEIFPRIYKFDRSTGGIVEITKNTQDFLATNILNGAVDDLLCGFGELPSENEFFSKAN